MKQLFPPTMLTNQKMTKNRFGRWAEARKKLNWMRDKWMAGQTVFLCTMLTRIQTTLKHASMFKATPNGLYMQSGKKWVCVDGCQLIA